MFCRKENGWWFTAPVKYLGRFASGAVRAAADNTVLRSVGEWYEKFRCDRFMEANAKEEQSIILPKLQLYNIKGKLFGKISIRH